MTAHRSEPSATIAAPVRVAESIRTRGFFSDRYARTSASTSRPSASVFSTSEVFPPRWRNTSPGRIAEPLGMFSANGIAVMTFTFVLSCESARMTASVGVDLPALQARLHRPPTGAVLRVHERDDPLEGRPFLRIVVDRALLVLGEAVRAEREALRQGARRVLGRIPDLVQGRRDHAEPD